MCGEVYTSFVVVWGREGEVYECVGGYGGGMGLHAGGVRRRLGGAVLVLFGMWRVLDGAQRVRHRCCGYTDGVGRVDDGLGVRSGFGRHVGWFQRVSKGVWCRAADVLDGLVLRCCIDRRIVA